MLTVKEIELGGKLMRLETGKLAKQASGAVVVTYGDTVVLCTVVAMEDASEGMDYLPLQVEYRERTAAVGKIPGGFFKREGKPSEKEILSARLIDRPIRPLFPENYFYETQVACTVYSSDQENDADVIAACGASAALMISDIPWDGPSGEVRVGRIKGEFIINPTHTQLQESDIDLVVAGTSDSIVMVEGESHEVNEQVLIEAIRFAHQHITVICNAIKELASEFSKPKREITKIEYPAGLADQVKGLVFDKMKNIHRTVMLKEQRHDANKELSDSIYDAIKDNYTETDEDTLKKYIDNIYHDLQYTDMREMILKENKRLDGRKTDEIRPITCEIGILPRNHGSALFTRGETQSLTSLTLGTKIDEQIIEGMLPVGNKSFMLHYNFPPFSTGETGRFSGPGRREIGHGHLAERSLMNQLPDENDFPYTIRLVSDILESNGSSSMATVCAGTLALMDGGVKIKRPVAGIAMGLIKENEETAVLSDILGSEDHFGDMDFKVCGTTEGITGFQMDIKIKGISFEILETALNQAKTGRMHILEIMKEAIAEPRETLSPYAPHIYSMQVPIDMIGAVIGPGGKSIRHIIELSKAEINIEDDGTVLIAALSGESAQIAKDMIGKIVELPEVGKVYKGRVVRVVDFGAFVEILPGKEGLLHISQIDLNRVNKVEDVLNRGDEVEVKLIGIDKETGKLSLSRKVLLEGYNEETHGGEKRREGSGGDRRRSGDGRRHDGDRREHRREGDRGDRRDRDRRDKR